MNALLPIGLGALALFLLGGTKKASAAPGLPGGPPASSQPGANMVPPDAVVQRIVAALATRNPATMRAEAERLDKEGWKAQAADLRAAALTIERESSGSGVSPVAPVIPLTVPVPIGGAGAPTVSQVPQPTANPPPSGDPRRLLAGKMVLNLMHSAKGREDKALVQAFQQQEDLKPDGKYGPVTAVRVADAYGIVPPKPFYWPVASMVATKAAYRTNMLERAKRDTARQDEWLAAAKV